MGLYHQQSHGIGASMVHPIAGDIPSITGLFDMACYSYVYPLKGPALQSREI